MTEATTIEAAAEVASQHAMAEGGSRSLASDAWRQLKKNPVFWVSIVLIAVFLLMAAVPQLFTQTDPTEAILKQARERPNANAWFGRDIQGYDIYARTIYGARASILVGVFTTLATVVLGVLLGVIAGFNGGFSDTIVSRVTDIFLAIPLLLGGILFMASFPNDANSAYFVVVGKVVLALGLLGWPSIARLMRSSVLQVKPNDYVQAVATHSAAVSTLAKAAPCPYVVPAVELSRMQ
jgi:oligopeptide transport system permease protein